MDLRDTPEEAQLRHEVRHWLLDALPTLPPEPPIDDEAAWRTRDSAWQRMLFDAGYAGLHWPAEHGGRGLSPVEHLVVLEEMARAGSPAIGVHFVGQMHAGPTLIAEGSEEQKARYLPPILRGEEVWCQGFSEPDAGSDLASLRTAARREGDHYIVTGQKIWTSHAGVADHCELLVRTDPDATKHRGITWLTMPMDSPGIEVRPLTTISGSQEFSELFLDEVPIPVANRVGAENDGWRVAMVTFAFERGTALVGEMVDAIALVGRLGRYLEEEGPAGAEAAALRRDLGVIAAELDGLWALVRRNVSEATATGTPGVGGSLFKLGYTTTRHRLADLSMRILGRARLITDGTDPRSAEHVQSWFHALALSIAAGTSQVQRNIVAERILGLPKEG